MSAAVCLPCVVVPLATPCRLLDASRGTCCRNERAFSFFSPLGGKRRSPPRKKEQAPREAREGAGMGIRETPEPGWASRAANYRPANCD